jgi:hypothetical protein
MIPCPNCHAPIHSINCDVRATGKFHIDETGTVPLKPEIRSDFVIHNPSVYCHSCKLSFLVMLEEEEERGEWFNIKIIGFQA